jgi:starch synthase (maltosyl-transferring)
MSLRPATVVIENVRPFDSQSRNPLKRIQGEPFVVEADIFKDGHDLIRALLKWRLSGTVAWNFVAMHPIPNGNDTWTGECIFLEPGSFEVTIEATRDAFLSWQHEFDVKVRASQDSLQSEILEGALLLKQAGRRAKTLKHIPDASYLQNASEKLSSLSAAEAHVFIHDARLEALVSNYADPSEVTEYRWNSPSVRALVESPRLPSSVALYPSVWVDRPAAGFAAWYEFFPRSAEGLEHRGSTFRDCLPRVDEARAMGFDTIYFPPIHPIGITARKGKNNAVSCQPGEPGVPYAIGNRFQNCPNGGGHRDVAPELGTLEDFDWLVSEIHARGLEVALDFAINCSPDHPYVHEHPEWFYQRPDGSIKYAENPPKKYQDVYPLNFHNQNWKLLWKELTDVVLFWARRKVRVFRVDNPHTKPVAFWEYLIQRVQEEFPDTIFLSEAFTRPKMMLALAKVGFTQSYTYFTWRNQKHEITDYFTLLTQAPWAEFFRPNLWPNTPDILPFLLQHGGKPAFLTRFVLAATLSPVYGIYSGYELCENAALTGKEEYLDSEKYQWKARDWDAPGNIKPWITRINAIRRQNRALHTFRNLRFLECDNDHLLCYAKSTPAGDNLLILVVNLDSWNSQSGWVEMPLDLLLCGPEETFEVEDLLSEERYLWAGPRNFVHLDTDRKCAHIFRVHRKTRREADFPGF